VWLSAQLDTHLSVVFVIHAKNLVFHVQGHQLCAVHVTYNQIIRFSLETNAMTFVHQATLLINQSINVFHVSQAATGATS
jgi:hypothetical protein